MSDQERKTQLLKRLNALSKRTIEQVENNDLLKAIELNEVIAIMLKKETSIRWLKKRQKDDQLISELLDKIKNGEK